MIKILKGLIKSQRILLFIEIQGIVHLEKVWVYDNVY